MAVINIGVDLGVTAKHHAEVINSEGAKLRFICEPTSMSWFPLAVYAKRNGHEIMRVKAQKSHDLRKYYSRHTKSDKLDVRALAMMPLIERESIEEVYLPDRVTNALNRRCRQREKISKVYQPL